LHIASQTAKSKAVTFGGILGNRGVMPSFGGAKRYRTVHFLSIVSSWLVSGKIGWMACSGGVVEPKCERAAILLGGDGNDDVEGGMICVIVIAPGLSSIFPRLIVHILQS
jgi:hypothetical protein